jgi:lycopene beta-cyclase
MGWALFANENFRRDLDLQPIQLQYGERVGFLQQVFDLLSTQANITFINQKVLEIEESETIILVQTEKTFSCSKLFNSIYHKQSENQTKYPVYNSIL